MQYFKKIYGRMKAELRSRCIIDISKPQHGVIVSGMGRSGTTWLSEIINYNNSYRVIFEPFNVRKQSDARIFADTRYMPASEHNPQLQRRAYALLAGRIRNSWIDRMNTKFVYKQRLIKVIRCNLMLGWLRAVLPLPLIFIIRHPLQVAYSHMRVNWNTHYFNAIISQKNLLEDYPVILKALDSIDPKNYIQQYVFIWSVFHYIAFNQLKNSPPYIIFYENLVNNFDREVTSLFNYYAWEYDNRIFQLQYRPSATCDPQTDIQEIKQDLLHGWMQKFAREDRKTAEEILAVFSLSGMYDFESDGMPLQTWRLQNFATSDYNSTSI